MTLAERDHTLLERKKQLHNDLAKEYAASGPMKKFYQERLFRQLRFNIPAGGSVLEIGCALGDMLARLEPSRGLGIDFSETMIKLAKERHPDLEFRLMDAHTFDLDEKFDFILLSGNLVGELIDVQEVLRRLRRCCHERTRIVLTYYNYFWAPLVKLAERMGLKPHQKEQNWLRVEDLENLMRLSDVDPIKTNRHMIVPLPLPTPAFADLVNDYVSCLPGISFFALNDLIVGRVRPQTAPQEHSVSVIVACKDERGNIEELIRKTPRMGKGTEMIFVDGHSKDGTLEEIERCIADLPRLNPELDSVRVYTQPGKGKGDAVRLGFDEAKHDILMILDADITVRPEDLPKFYDALVRGEGEFINGTRLVYPMEDDAMRFLNMLANHFFGLTFSWLLSQRLTDTLCGTKVLFRKDYESIKRGRTFFGDFDPFMDFDLLFGAAKLNLKIQEIPIRYRNREYGEIKIDRFRHGLLLLKMAGIGFQRFKLHRQVGE